MEETGAGKPSSFRDRIAAFNKTSDAPLAPRTMPKPTSFVRKPFIPPPPSKSSYFVTPKASASAKPPSSDQAVTSRETPELPGQTHREPQTEPELGKDNFKERILAIQKGLHYTNPGVSRGPAQLEGSRDTDDVEDVLQPSDTGKPDEEAVRNITEEAMGHEMSDQRLESTNEIEMETVNAPDESVEDKGEIDPEVARRIAIRERMAKMSGGMGMHMGIGLPPAYPRGKTTTKVPSFPPSSPPLGRLDPIPVIPGLPPLKAKDPERRVSKPITETSEGARSLQEEDAVSLEDEAPREDDSKDRSKQSRAEEDPGSILHSDKPLSMTEPENDSESGREPEIASTTAHKAPHEDEDYPSTENSDVESVSSPPESNGQLLEPATSFPGPFSLPKQYSHDTTQHAGRPPIPTAYSSSKEIAPRSRPPPPPPPAPPVTIADLPRSPIAEDSSPAAVLNVSKERKRDSGIDTSDPEHLPEVVTTVLSPSSPKPPSFRPPLPPLQVMPPRTPSIPTKAPPIPAIPRNFETANTSLDQFYAPPSEIMTSPIELSPPTAKHTDEIQSPYSPPSPTPPTFRTSLSERTSQDISRNRSSLETARREVPYMAMKEENLQDGEQWWLESEAPPGAFKNRSDVVCEVEDSTSTRRGNHIIVTRQVYILFSDYSQTQVTAQYSRDAPSQVALSQRHLPPPPQPTKSDLETRHQQIGHRVVALAQTRVGTSVGDGSPLALVHDVFGKLGDCLPSAGVRSHGALVFSNFGNSSTRQFDEIRAGDVVAFRNAIFQVHGGLRGKSTVEVGKPDHVAIVQEWNGSKRKLKVLEQRQDIKRVVSSGYRLGDLRSGEVHVFRPMPRSWVDW
jgi:myosin tail region-interacting protein MTI1